MKIKKARGLILFLCTFIFVFSIIKYNDVALKKDVLLTNSSAQLSNKKICWGIKREPAHKQPDVGKQNKMILDKYNGICLGEADSKKVYLTFDSGYEAGYMEKILEVLKQNNVKACFFITAHYLNTQPDLVKRMIEDGHIVGNHAPKFLMSGIDKI